MKPFNLEEALAGKPVVTRDGRLVTELHKFDVDGIYKVAAVVSRDVKFFTVKGQYCASDHQNGHDLFMAPTKRTVWVNLYPTGVAVQYPSQEAADMDRCLGRVGGKAHPIEIEE